MLGIDFAFFVLELGVGLVVGSLALMADAFHMVGVGKLLGHLRLVLIIGIVERHNIASCRTMGCQSSGESLYRQILLWRQYFLYKIEFC
jgi:hypothetical protein